MALSRDPDTRTVGIYSFPKSGNTWIRAIVGALMPSGGRGVPDLHRVPFAEAEQARGFRFYKHHGAQLLRHADDAPLATSHVIHIRRNPLDVFLSYLNFLSDNVTGTAPIRFASVDAIRGTELFDAYFASFAISGHIASERFRFAALTDGYFSHNNRWLARAGNPRIRCIRYEDLSHDPVGTLAFLQDWLGLETAEIAQMVRLADRRTRQDGRFFWRRQERNYLNYLEPRHIEFFVTHRGEEAAALGYDAAYLRAEDQREDTP